MKFVLHGKQGKTLIVDEDFIRIEKKAPIFGSRREKAIAIQNIAGVQVKKPGAFAGYVRFSIAGGAVRDSSLSLSGGAFDAVQDENSIVFLGSKNYLIAQDIKNYVESWPTRNRMQSSGPAASVADEIRKLKALMDEGVLTQSEFEQKKKSLLGL